MRIVNNIIFVLILLLFQSVVLSRIAPFNSRPDVLLVAVIIIGLLYGPVEGLLAGLLCGFISDMNSSTIYVLTYTFALIGLASGIIKGTVFKDEQQVVMIFVFAGSILVFFLNAEMLYYFQGVEISNFWITAFISAIFNAALTPVIQSALARINKNE